jgi:hypothetical protein
MDPEAASPYKVRFRGPLGQLLLGPPHLGPSTTLERVAALLAEQWKLSGSGWSLVLTWDPQGRKGLVPGGPKDYAAVTLGGLGIK